MSITQVVVLCYRSPRTWNTKGKMLPLFSFLFSLYLKTKKRRSQLASLWLPWQLLICSLESQMPVWNHCYGQLLTFSYITEWRTISYFDCCSWRCLASHIPLQLKLPLRSVHPFFTILHPCLLRTNLNIYFGTSFLCQTPLFHRHPLPHMHALYIGSPTALLQFNMSYIE